MSQKENPMIELRHPIAKLKALGNALETLSQPSLSNKEISRLRMVIREARACQQLFTAHLRYQKFRLKNVGAAHPETREG